jgi:ABC-type sugar transport system permease subunit
MSASNEALASEAIRPVRRQHAGGRGGRSRRLGSRRTAWGAAMLSPAMVVIVLFVFIPIVLTFWISLHEWSMFTSFGDMQWRGMANYRELLHDSDFHNALRNTAVYVLLVLVITVPLSVLLALLLYFPQVRGRALVRTALFSTYVIPTVAISMVWGALYAPNYGPLAALFDAIGLPAPQFLSSPSSALLSLVVFHVWQMLGYYVVLIVAGLTQIPVELYEAARLDGAGPIRQTVSITLPLLGRTLTFVVLIAIVNAVQVFDPVYVLTQGGPADSTNVLSFDIQRTAFEHGLAGQASAMAFSLLFVLVALGGMGAAFLRSRR